MARILTFSGSSRKDSLNDKLVRFLGSLASEAGATVTHISLADYPLAIYNGDDEAELGQPENAARLRDLISDHDGLIIGCPEYNGFMTPLLINTIDWCTRAAGASPDLSAFMDRKVLIAASSPGPGGAGRAAAHLRTMLNGIGSIVVPMPVLVPNGFSAFEDDGSLTNDKMARMQTGKLLHLCEKL
ncbi:MAG: NAD(P)H-dependent oxidoreductase [Pseudomonadales bacterium]|nr:NAD(P)H-dependent oxidoreductase [Pseudomonadales bacterium]